ncbi:MAG: N-acetylmannosamine-6-phosphate 2-epimerase [Granulosicoccus sp.]
MNSKAEDRSNNVLAILQGRLVVSCQPVSGGPMDRTDIIVAFAEAAILGGAAGLRIEGAGNVAAVLATLDVPVIGLIKHETPEGLRITPGLDDVQALVEAGAHVIAFDATQRTRKHSIAEMVQTIHAAGRLAMADCSSADDASEAFAAGADILGTTLSGYTGDTVPEGPDLSLIETLRMHGVPVFAEGRYNSPELARGAIVQGAWAVVVGSAITRAEHVTGWFADAIARAERIR